MLVEFFKPNISISCIYVCLALSADILHAHQGSLEIGILSSADRIPYSEQELKLFQLSALSDLNRDYEELVERFEREGESGFIESLSALDKLNPLIGFLIKYHPPKAL